MPVQFLPSELWVLGLGHLGNAYLDVSLFAVRESDGCECPSTISTLLSQRISDTGMIFGSGDADIFKTRICDKWLERRGFRTRLIERPFDSNFRCRAARPQMEPRLALCGFDSNPARRDLATANFLRVMESGLGGTKDNFDTISFHTLPNPRSPAELWPDLSQEEQARQQEYLDRVAHENPGYAALGDDVCGRAIWRASPLPCRLSERPLPRLFSQRCCDSCMGVRDYTDIKMALSDSDRLFAETTHNYGALDLVGLRSCDAATVQPGT